MVPRASPAVVPPPILRPDWETLAWLASTWSKLLDLDVCPTPSSSCWFCATTDKPKLAWFWGPNQETVAVILRPKSPNRSCWFWGPNRETQAIGFEAKPGETITTDFEAKPGETVPVVFRPNHWEIVDLGFEAQPRNLRSSSPHARCRLHTTSPDLSIVGPPSTWSVLDHPRSSAPGLLLLPRSSSLPAMPHLPLAHHETIKCDSPHETKIKVKLLKCPGLEFKPWDVNDSSQSNDGTYHLVSQCPTFKQGWLALTKIITRCHYRSNDA
jgi:hypothetical protein